MNIKSNAITLIIAGCVISLITSSLAKLTGHLINGSPLELNIAWVDVLSILFAGIAFVVFMKTVNKSKQIY